MPTVGEAREIIENHLATMNGFAEQIAFFGGSFTGISKEKQNEYLALAEEYIKKGAFGASAFQRARIISILKR